MAVKVVVGYWWWWWPISGDGCGCVGRVLRLSGCCGGVDSFCKVGICVCLKRAIVKWMLCHGGIDIGGVVVGMMDIVGYFTNGEIMLVLIYHHHIAYTKPEHSQNYYTLANWDHTVLAPSDGPARVPGGLWKFWSSSIPHPRGRALALWRLNRAWLGMSSFGYDTLSVPVSTQLIFGWIQKWIQ